MAIVICKNYSVEDTTKLQVLYALFLAYPLLGIPAFLALVLNFVMSCQPRVTHSPLALMHLKWQRHSAFIGILILVASYNTQKTWVSCFMMVCGAAWFSYRMIRGWLEVSENQGFSQSTLGTLV